MIYDNSVLNIRDDLDNYGNHLPVFIEDLSGNLYEVGDIRTSERSEGVIVIIEMGDRK